MFGKIFLYNVYLSCFLFKRKKNLLIFINAILCLLRTMVVLSLYIEVTLICIISHVIEREAFHVRYHYTFPCSIHDYTGICCMSIEIRHSRTKDWCQSRCLQSSIYCSTVIVLHLLGNDHYVIGIRKHCLLCHIN